MDFTNFWTSFLAGIATAVVVGIGTVSVRRVIKSHSSDSTVFDKKQLRALLIICLGVVFLLVGIFIKNDEPILLTTPGILLIIVGVWNFI